MTTYGSYGRGGSMLSAYIFMFALAAVVVCGILLLLEAGRPIETPQPVYDEPFADTGGIDVDKAVKEAQSLLLGLEADGEKGYLAETTCGLLRVFKDRNGEVYIAGHNNEEGLLAAAKEIADQIGATVGAW